MRRLLARLRRHRHRDEGWQAVGNWCYYQCACGARRIRRRYVNGYGPADPAWAHLLVSRNGQSIDDSGWVERASAA